MQELFFDELFQTMDVETDKLTELYMTYYNNVPSCQTSMIFDEMNKPWKDVEVSVFDAKTNKFVNSFFSGLSEKKTVSVMECYYSQNG